MKILAIMGSPRTNGNTYNVTKQVEKEMKKLGKVEFEYLFLKDANLQPCKGCSQCIKKGEKSCSLKDDLSKIERMIMDADGVILASPVYVMQVSWLMKVLVDRLAFLSHRPRFFKQKAMVIATTGAVGLKETLDYLEMVAGGWGITFVHKLGIETPFWPKTSNSNKKNMKKICNAANIFYNVLKQDKLPSLGLNEYMRFKILKEVSIRLKEYVKADYEFYKDKREYYYRTNLNIFMKLIAWSILKVGLFMFRDNFAD